MKVLAGNLKGATSVKDAQGSCRALSKLLVLGTKYRLFFPVVQDEVTKERDILLAAVPGRKLDYDKLKRSFITLEDFEQSETGRIVDKSGLSPYARIARVIFDAECKAEKAAAKKEAEDVAKATGMEIDSIALNQKLREIELAYNGDRDAKPSPVYATKNPMISSVVVEIATEVFVVPLTSGGDPEWGKSFVASFPISGRKSKQLTELVSNKDYCPEGAQYLEVSYNYAGTDKKTAGMDATLQGVAASLSLATTHKESWEANKNALDRLSKSAEAIASKNMSMSSTVTAKEVVELFKKYTSKNPLILLHVDTNSDIVKKAAKDMVEFEIGTSIPSLKERLLEVVNSQAASSEDEEDLDAKEVAGAAAATTISELAAATADIDGLTGGEDVTNIDDI